MRTRTLLPLALAGALALTACGSGTEVATDDPTAVPTDGGTQSIAPPVELADGVAATVDGEDIPADRIDRRVEQLAADPRFGQGPQGEELDEEQVKSTLRAQILTQEIFSRIILQGAEELDAEPGPEDIAAARDELVQQVGGEEAFQEQVEATGFTEAELEEELRVLAAIGRIGERLAEEGEVDPGAPTPPQSMSAEDVAAQQWLIIRIQEADVQVDQAYGRWDPAGQVVPTRA